MCVPIFVEILSWLSQTVGRHKARDTGSVWWCGRSNLGLLPQPRRQSEPRAFFASETPFQLSVESIQR